MNVVIAKPAEGLPPRRAFSVEDIRRMVDAGVIDESERIELIEGDVVVMAAKSIAHDRLQNILNLALSKVVPAGFFVGNGNSLRLGDDILVEPDLAIIATSVYEGEASGLATPRPDDIPLVIEISASSLGYDRNAKARLYARHGFHEYWVIDVNERTTWVYTGPSGDGWSSIVERGPNDILTTPALPGFAIKLGEIA